VPTCRMLTVAALVLLPTASFAQTKDITLDATERFMKTALAAAKDTPMPRLREDSQVFTMLRATRDPAVLPVFVKLAQSNAPENQAYAYVASATITKDSAKANLAAILQMNDAGLVGTAISALMDADLLNEQQLMTIATTANDPAHRVMAAGELNRKGKLANRELLTGLLKANKDIVRYFAAISLLETKDAAEVQAALATLRELTAKNDAKAAPIQALMFSRIAKFNIAAAAPWVESISADEKADEDLRRAGVVTLLSLKRTEGARLYGAMVQSQREIGDQIKLALIGIEFAEQIKPATFEPIEKSRSTLAKSLGVIARQAAEGNDINGALVRQMREGHPLVLDWALIYADRAEPERRRVLRQAIISQATVVDGVRGKDFERAVIATQRLLEEATKPDRAIVAELLKSPNRAVVEAVVAGAMRSNATNLSELILPHWEALSKTAATEAAANYAAIVLAREGRQESLAWLSGMVQGGTVQTIGFRVIAGWYYAKLQNQHEDMLKRVLAGS